ncbi:MAG TPA: DUF2092 domain-containing protein [Rhizomicrobium sp.]|nr:DUF2092 domain-containing protein [Rhizomicrobium sp.]
MRQAFSLKLPCAVVLSCLISFGVEAAEAAKDPAQKEAAAASEKAPTAKAVDPDALAALDKMGAYLRTLKSFEIKADTLTDNVLENGQSVQFAGTVDYKVRRPNGFMITVADDRKIRQFSYDGKSFTIFSPRMGFYATVSAPSTIRELLDRAYERYGIALPMDDLFRWGEPGDKRENIKSGFPVGYAKLGGQDADQYVFRSANIDWQIWIARGDKPLPLKVVLTDTSDPARPQYTATYHWTPSATFTDATFAFKPPSDSKPIKIAER